MIETRAQLVGWLMELVLPADIDSLALERWERAIDDPTPGKVYSFAMCAMRVVDSRTICWEMMR